MLAHMHSFDVFLWIAIAIGQCLVSIILIRQRINRRYPAFCLYVHFSAITTLLLMAIPSGWPWLIFWSYYAIEVGSSALMIFAVGALYQNAFGKEWVRVPAWVPRNVGVWLALAISACAILPLAMQPMSWNKYMVYMSGLDEAMVTGVMMSLVILMIYSRHLGISLRPWPMRIAMGFLLFLSVNSITLYTLGSAPRGTAEVMRRLGQLAYFASLAWWGFTLRGKETVPEKATAAQVAEMVGHTRGTLDAVAQLAKV